MATIKYRYKYGVGSSSSPWEYTTLYEFIKISNQLFYSVYLGHYMPPLSVLNDFFLNYTNDKSNNIIWRAFSIDEIEYQELVEELLSEPSSELQLDSEYKDISSFKKWREKSFQRKLADKKAQNSKSV
jgi:hypothetical protein